MKVTNLIENGNLSLRAGNAGCTEIPITPEETFINDVYASMDTATADGLDLLRSENGIEPTCRAGCAHCCRYHILTNSAEIHTLVQYLKRELSAEQMDALQLRTQRWHEWDSARPGRRRNMDGAAGDPSHYDHSCPLLVDEQCSAYAVRPAVCRSHFVTSAAELCSTANDPLSTEQVPSVVDSLVEANSPYRQAIRDRIEGGGMKFSHSATLLPQGLAIEMGWNFAVDSQ